MFTRMRTPKTRSEFERAFDVALEQMREGRMMFPRDANDYIFSLRSVRRLPNGRMDLLSVDEFARLHANQTLNFLDSLQPSLDEQFDRGNEGELSCDDSLAGREANEDDEGDNGREGVSKKKPVSPRKKAKRSASETKAAKTKTAKRKGGNRTANTAKESQTKGNARRDRPARKKK